MESVKFATTLVDMRLLQTARLLEWIRDNGEADGEAVGRALDAVVAAHGSIRGLRSEPAAG